MIKSKIESSSRNMFNNQEILGKSSGLFYEKRDGYRW